MATALDQLPDGARCLIVRLRSLGDCVLTTPAIELLKKARPDLRIGVVVERRFRAIFEGNPNLSDLLDPDTAAIARFSPHLCVNFHGGTRSVGLTALSRAGLRAGFAHFRHGWVYNIRIPTAQEILGISRKVHTAEHLASAVFHLGVPQEEIPRAALFADRLPDTRPYAVLHPMASAPDKTWPADRFLAVAAHLEDQCGLEPVFIAGPGEDLSRFGAHRCVGAASLAEVKQLLAGASLFVGNDSGPAHMAAAFGLPVVVLFGSSDPVIWAPWKTQAESILAPAEGIQAIATEDVVRALEKLRVRA